MKTTLIIGATSDIGLELVAQLLRNGDRRVLAQGHSSMSRLEQFAGHELFQPLQCDLSCGDSLFKLAETVVSDDPPSECVFLAASKLRYHRFRELAWSDVSSELQLQIQPPMVLLQKVLPALKARAEAGKVVFMLSSVILNPAVKNLAHYCMAKSATLGLMRALAAENSDGLVTFNAVSPSMVNTRFLDEVPHKLVEMTGAKHPMGRNACVQDVVGVLQFLLSPASDYMNGVNLPVTGGAFH